MSTAISKPAASRRIMQSRIEPPDSLQFFPTPPWATRALVHHLIGISECKSKSVWEPAAGEGHMAEVLGEYFDRVHASDVHDYGVGYKVGSFVGNGGFDLGDLASCPYRPHWIITNPPFTEALAFTLRALEVAQTGVAMLVPFGWLTSQRRHAALFSKTPPTKVGLFVERCPMHSGRWDPDGDTATDYCWCVWRKGNRRGSRMVWIEPGQRKGLEKPGDRRRFGGTARDQIDMLEPTPE